MLLFGIQKKITVLITLFLLIPIAFGIETDAVSDKGRCEKLRVAGSVVWYPVAYHSLQTKNPEGVAYQLVIELSRLLDIPVEIESRYPWGRVMLMSRVGELDIVAGVVRSIERSQYMHYSQPFFRENLYVFVHQHSSIQIATLDDLKQYKRVDFRFSSVGEKLESYLSDSVEAVSDDRQRIDFIIAGRADYIIASETEIEFLRQKDKKWMQVKKLPLQVSSIDAVLGVSKNSPCAALLPEINRIISELYPSLS